MWQGFYSLGAGAWQPALPEADWDTGSLQLTKERTTPLLDYPYPFELSECLRSSI